MNRGHAIDSSDGALQLHEALAAIYAPYRERRVSAMVRVKDEEQFLEPSVRSIVDLVDEVVLVDNLSRDRSPAIIEALRDEHPEKIVCWRYTHPIRKVGRETNEIASDRSGRCSPNLSANYYNWCMARCREPFVLKWDADMIATPRLAQALAEWRASDRPVLVFHGANVHPDMRHLLAARCDDHAELTDRLGGTGVPKWVAAPTCDFPEPRLFPKAFAWYDSSIGWTQRLVGPFCQGRALTTCGLTVADPLFLHLKFCKSDPLGGYSADLAALIADNMIEGPEIDPESAAVLRRWGIGERLPEAVTAPQL